MVQVTDLFISSLLLLLQQHDGVKLVNDGVLQRNVFKVQQCARLGIINLVVFLTLERSRGAHHNVATLLLSALVDNVQDGVGLGGKSSTATQRSWSNRALAKERLDVDARNISYILCHFLWQRSRNFQIT